MLNLAGTVPAGISSSDDLVLTDKPGARQVRQPVANLTVRTNVSSVKPLTNSPDGFIEFYTSSYAAKRSATPAGGDDRVYDFNDTPTNPSKFGYGCLQVHDLAAKKTIFSFNHFNNARVACDVGIGPAPRLDVLRERRRVQGPPDTRVGEVKSLNRIVFLPSGNRPDVVKKRCMRYALCARRGL